ISALGIAYTLILTTPTFNKFKVSSRPCNNGSSTNDHHLLLCHHHRALFLVNCCSY
uniref:Uncharacterized protein n=1 Tax=Aegilops tauschii subsp. strangulata TaxID=200361 RepID=A0A453QMJ5_AEGTS